MRHSTKIQRNAVAFCEEIFNIKFKGDINSYKDTSLFLEVYLSEARRLYTELRGYNDYEY